MNSCKRVECFVAVVWNAALPDNVPLLTLEQYPSFGPAPSETQPFLLRLEHFCEKGEDPVLSEPVTVNLQVEHFVVECSCPRSRHLKQWLAPITSVSLNLSLSLKVCLCVCGGVCVLFLLSLLAVHE